MERYSSRENIHRVSLGVLIEYRGEELYQATALVHLIASFDG